MPPILLRASEKPATRGYQNQKGATKTNMSPTPEHSSDVPLLEIPQEYGTGTSTRASETPAKKEYQNWEGAKKTNMPPLPLNVFSDMPLQEVRYVSSRWDHEGYQKIKKSQGVR